MPTEHEYKYVINMDLLKHHSEEQLKIMCKSVLHIRQGYLAFSKGMSCRIRCSSEWGTDKWFLTFKQKVTKRTIEIEKKIDTRDGADLWELAVGKLKKDRYIFPHDGVKWELDLFKFDSEIYFIMAEIELDENAPRPKHVLPLLKNYVLYEVPLTDDRFSSKRLGDVNYSKQLYSLLLEEDKDVRNSNPTKEGVRLG
jgi:CYTH domain-containing protein